jgi:hypothetical protein
LLQPLRFAPDRHRLFPCVRSRSRNADISFTRSG